MGHVAVIIDAVATFILGIASFVFGLLPAAGSLGLDSFAPAISMFRAFNEGLPVVETLGMAAGCLAIIGGIFVTRLAITIWDLIPFKFS
jgi:hypothetical protein